MREYRNSFLETQQKDQWREIEQKHHLKFEITDDYEEAKDIVQELLDSGEQLIITVPEEWIEHVKKHGMSPTAQADKSGRGEHYSILAARIGSDPYFNKGEFRYVVEIDPKGLKILPRLTGRDAFFAGVVAIEGSVSPKQINILGQFDTQSWANQQELDKKKAA